MQPWGRSDPLSDIAARLADGDVLDWDTLESSAPDELTRELIRHLRIVATVGRVHALEDFESGASGTHASITTLPDIGPLPATWGSLRVLAVIGRGRFGTVYRAWDPALDREVALKLLHTSDLPSAVGDGTTPLTHVIEEARVMARIRHPNVVTIFGAQRTEGRIGIWMELVEGQTLEAELAARGPLPPADIVGVGIELCHALTAVHDAKLVHRDVKAQNVLRDVNGRITLGDFGTGRELEDALLERSLAGTPAYLAPEIFDRGAATERSDLYSLGILLFHLATRSYPVLGRSLGELRDAHAQRRRDSLLALRPDFPPAASAAIERALERDPADRYASARDMASSLAAAVTPAAPLHRRALAKLFVAIIVTTVGASGWALWNGTDNSSGDRAGSAAANAIGAAGDGNVGQRQLSDDPLFAGPGAPSHDGRLLSFADSGNLAILDLATGSRRQITDNGAPDRRTGEAVTSRFTVDDRALFYVWYPADRAPAELRLIGTDGKKDRLVWAAPPGRELTLGHWAGGDDVIVASLWAENETSEIVLIPTAGGTVKRTPVDVYRDGATLAPDGRTVAFHGFEGATNSVYLMGEGGTITPLFADGNVNVYPTWTGDGRHLLFLSDRTGDVGLWAQRMQDGRASGPPDRIEPNFGVAFPMGVTDAGTYVYRRQLGGRDVYVAQLDEQGHLSGEPARLSPVRGDATGTSAWSWDGTHIAFFRRRDYRRSLVVRDLSAGREREFAGELEGVARPRWEPGDRSLLFKGMHSGRQGLFRLDLGSGAIARVMELVGFYEVAPAGEIVFTPAANRTRLFRRTRDGQERLLHDSGGRISGLAVSPDGVRLAYSVGVGQRRCLRVIEMDLPKVARDVQCVTRPEGLELFAWTPDGLSLLANRTELTMGDNGIWSFDASASIGHWLGIGPGGAHQEFRLSPSGRQLSYDVGSPYQEVWAIDNILSRLAND